MGRGAARRPRPGAREQRAGRRGQEVYAPLQDTVAEAYQAGWLTTATDVHERVDVPRMPSPTVPDAYEVVEVDDEAIDVTSDADWTLDEIEAEEIDVTLD